MYGFFVCCYAHATQCSVFCFVHAVRIQIIFNHSIVSGGVYNIISIVCVCDCYMVWLCLYKSAYILYCISCVCVYFQSSWRFSRVEKCGEQYTTNSNNETRALTRPSAIHLLQIQYNIFKLFSVKNVILNTWSCACVSESTELPREARAQGPIKKYRWKITTELTEEINRMKVNRARDMKNNNITH